MTSKHNDEPLVPWKEIAAQSIDRTEALEAERDGFRAEVGLLLLSVKTFETERDELRAEVERLRADGEQGARALLEQAREIERLRALIEDHNIRTHGMWCASIPLDRYMEC
jgi:uncharacterized coiled-coil DUF342 family protein